MNQEDFLNEVESYLSVERKRYRIVEEFDFPLPPQAKERHGKSGHSKLKTRAFEQTIKQILNHDFEDRYIPKPETRLGVRIVFVVKKEGRGDLDNYEKSVLDGMNSAAYKDDRRIRYCEKVEAVRPSEGERILVQLLERTEGTIGT